MGLTIELSFDVTKNANVTSIKQLLSNLAEKHNSTTNYFMHEIEGHGTTIVRNDCINVVEFDSDNIKNIINYIKDIIKIKFIKIDSVYEEKGAVNIIYSGRYTHTSKYVNPISGKYSHTTKNNILELVKQWGIPHTPINLKLN